MITIEDVDAIQSYVEDVMSRMGCQGDAARGDGAVELDGDSGEARISVPYDADAGTFCDILAQLLGRAGYSMWDVWIDQWNPTTVNIGDKEFETA